MQNAIGLDHTASVLKRFYKGSQREVLARRVEDWLRFVNLDTIDLLDDVIELSASSGGRMNAGFRSAMLALTQRESVTRQGFLSEATNLRADLEALCLTNRARQNKQISLSWPRLAKQAAAALLAIGIPTTVGNYQAIAQQAETAPAVSTASQNKATCSLVGRVTDPSRAVVPNAEITITNDETGLVRTVKTNETGQYVVNDLGIGRYTVKAHMQGFKTTERTGIVLEAGDRVRLDLGLTIGYVGGGCCEYAAGPLTVEVNPYQKKKKPFTYVVGDADDQFTLQGIAKLVYGDSKAWIQIFEANRSAIAKPGVIPYGTPMLIPPRKRVVPKLISKVTPVYPPSVEKEHIWGDVLLDVTLKEDGTVEQTSVIAGNPLLVEAARSAVRQWRYRPLLVNGKPVLKFVVAVSFGKGGKVR
jgi:TonB family protein